MHRRQCLRPALGEQREVEVVSVEMGYIKGICAARHAIERYKMIDEWILALGAETQRPGRMVPSRSHQSANRRWRTK